MKLPKLRSGLLPLLLGTAVWSQEPAPLARGFYQGANGNPAALAWTTKNLKAAAIADGLRLEVEPKARGTAETAPLTLAPLRVYTATLTCRRGPGVGLDIRVYWRNAAKQPENRQLVWQLPQHARPNWWPLSPNKTVYAQRFILPADAQQVTVQIALTGNPDTVYNYFELCDLNLERGADVPFGARAGPNRLGAGTMEQVNNEGMAIGWSWWGAPSKAEVVPGTAGRTAHGGERFLAIMPGRNCILAGGYLPVESGRGYRLSFWARGKGDIGAGAQALSDDTPVNLRVGDAQQQPFHVDTADWQYFEQVWFAEALHAQFANPFMGITPQTEIDLDDIAFQRIEP